MTEPPRVNPSVFQTSDAAELAAAHWDTPDRDAEGSVDPLEMTSEPFIEETLDAIDLDSIEDREPEREPSPEDRPRRRRRRRGRGRGRRPEGQAPAPEGPAAAGFNEQPTAAEFDEPPVAGADAATEVESSENAAAGAESPDRLQPKTDETDEGRETRRRRRRRGRGRGSRREEGVGDAQRPPRRREESVAKAPTTPAAARDDIDDSDDEDSLEAIEQEDDLGDDEEGKGDDSQFSHKKIPSWQEAIESVIATNMTSRVNNPSSGSRGGRGRGRRDR